MKSLIFLLCALAAFSSNSNAQEFKVMTYNILGSNHTDLSSDIGKDLPWSIRKEGVFEVIEKAKPDIFALQEDTIDQTNDVNSHFTSESRQKRYKRVPIIEGESGGISGHGLYTGDKQHAYGSIFYDVAKFELLDYDEFLLESGLDSKGRDTTKYVKWAQLLHIVSKKELFVSNAHFTHRGPSSDPGYAERLARQDDSAEKLAKVMWNKVDDTPYISFGDMNNFPSSRPIQFLTNDKDTMEGMTYYPNHKRLQIDDKRSHSDNNDVTRVTINNILDNHVLVDKNMAAKLIDHILASEELTKPYNTQRFTKYFKADNNIDTPCIPAQVTSDKFDHCRDSDHWAVMATVRFKNSNSNKNSNSSKYYNYLSKVNAEPEFGPNLLVGSLFNGLSGLSHTQSAGPAYSLGNGWSVVPSGAQLAIDIDDSDNTGTPSSPAGHPSHLRLTVEPGVGNTNAYLGINQKIDDRYLELENSGFGHVSFFAKTNANKTLKTYFHLGALNSTGQTEKVIAVENVVINGIWTKYDRCFSMPVDFSGSSTTDMRLTIGYQDQQVSDLENDLIIDNVLLRSVDSCK